MEITVIYFSDNPFSANLRIFECLKKNSPAGARHDALSTIINVIDNSTRSGPSTMAIILNGLMQ